MLIQPSSTERGQHYSVGIGAIAAGEQNLCAVHCNRVGTADLRAPHTRVAITHAHEREVAVVVSPRGRVGHVQGIAIVDETQFGWWSVLPEPSAPAIEANQPGRADRLGVRVITPAIVPIDALVKIANPDVPGGCRLDVLDPVSEHELPSKLAERIPMSEHLFAGRRTTTARLTDYAEAMGNDVDPILCSVGPATAHRRPHAIQLLGRLFPTDLLSPASPTFRLSAAELLPFREQVQDGIGMPGAMAAVARPGRLARIGHHRGPHRVGLDVPQNDEQVVAVLDDRGSEAALPGVAAGSLSPVVPPGVSDGQGLEDGLIDCPGAGLRSR